MMNAQIPVLDLTHGQLLWILGQGASPRGRRRRLLLDQLRYLRQLAVPFAEQGRGQGRGHAIHYSYEEVVEMAVALFALRRGVRPHLVADYLVTNRATLHRTFGMALEAQPAADLKVSWLTRRGRPQALPANNSFPRQHNRTREISDSYDLETVRNAPKVAATRRQEPLFPEGPAATLIPLTRLVLKVLDWARRAPDIKRGRQVKGAPSPTASSRVRA